MFWQLNDIIIVLTFIGNSQHQGVLSAIITQGNVYLP